MTADRPTIPLDRGYSYEADSMDAAAWRGALASFADANIYQTWPYDAAFYPGCRSSRLLLRRNGNVVAAVQARVAQIPVIRRGIAYLRWGPIWRGPHKESSREVLRQCLLAIRQEYAERRRLVVRILPRTVGENESWLPRLFREEGFRRCEERPLQRTVIMDISQSLEQIRKGLHQKWRNGLNSARKQPQEILVGRNEGLFDCFATLHRAMSVRKGLEENNDVSALCRLQGQLPDVQKMEVILCRSGTDFVAGAVVSSLGSVGLYLHGASHGIGLRQNSSYLVQWRAIDLLKQRGCIAYDLNGATRETNPDTYRFKTRLAGKQGTEVERFGLFESCCDPLSRLIVRIGMRWQSKLCELWPHASVKKNVPCGV